MKKYALLFCLIMLIADLTWAVVNYFSFYNASVIKVEFIKTVIACFISAWIFVKDHHRTPIDTEVHRFAKYSVFGFLLLQALMTIIGFIILFFRTQFSAEQFMALLTGEFLSLFVLIGLLIYIFISALIICIAFSLSSYLIKKCQSYFST